MLANPILRFVGRILCGFMGFRFLVVEGRGYVAVGWMRGELFCRREEEAN